eukprot:jgi/Mesvir1/19078/Mv12833-RA.1
MFILEETVDLGLRLSTTCDHCSCIGWSHHPVAAKRYHFVLPSDASGAGSWAGKGKRRFCPKCSSVVPNSVRHCSGCRSDAVRRGVPESQSHLLHGVIHLNGFGHLLRINGREGGSAVLTGGHLMDLWDRICTMLCARMVSVEDVSKKRQMELRLLHSVAYGMPWYGRWGYRFGRGTYGTCQVRYEDALRQLAAIPLSSLQGDFLGVDDACVAILELYTALYRRLQAKKGVSTPTPVSTLGDLVRAMLEVKADAPPGLKGGGATTRDKARGGGGGGAGSVHGNGNRTSGAGKDRAQTAGCKSVSANGSATAAASNGNAGSPAVDPLTSPCRWSAKRVELATSVIVEVLRSAPRPWLPRQEVRDSARAVIGDTGLLDYVLKSLGDRVVGDHVVRREFNPATKVLEYRLDEVAKASGAAAQGGGSSDADKDGVNKMAVAAPAVWGGDGGSDSGDKSEVAVGSWGVGDNGVKLESQGGVAALGSSNGAGGQGAVSTSLVGREDVMSDLQHLYAHVLESYKPLTVPGVASRVTAASIPSLVQIVLDTKHFVKDYGGERILRPGGALSANSPAAADLPSTPGTDPEESLIAVKCTFSLGADSLGSSRIPCSPPPELFMVPVTAMVGDVKRQASKAFQEMYPIFNGFVVEGLAELDWADDADPLAGLVGTDTVLTLTGTGVDLGNPTRCEGGGDTWTVRCTCGTVDDDGERMVACDICEVWQHTRCGGIADAADVPPRFTCMSCSVGDNGPVDFFS